MVAAVPVPVMLEIASLNLNGARERGKTVVFLNTLDNVLCSCEAEEILLLGGDFNSTELKELQIRIKDQS